MAEYPIYRLVKGDQLTFTEMDNNLRWLSQNMSGSELTLTGSTISMTGSVRIEGDLQVYGTASIGFLNTIAFSTGSNQLGNDTLDVQTLIGTVNISGSLNVSGSTYIPDLTGSLFGTASWAENALTSSYALNAVSASYAPNLYNSDGTLSGNRTINYGGNYLSLNGDTKYIGTGGFTGLTPKYYTEWASTDPFAVTALDRGIGVTVRIDTTGSVSTPVSQNFTTALSVDSKITNSGSSYVTTRAIQANSFGRGLQTSQRVFLTGIESQVFRNSTLDVSNHPQNYIDGIYLAYGHGLGSPESIGTGTITGVNNRLLFMAGTASVVYSNQAYIYQSAHPSHRNSRITNYYAYFADGLIGTTSGQVGIISNYYGLYLNPPTVRGTSEITNRWGVYAPDSVMSHSFQGNVVIGGNVVDGNKLDVRGNTRISGSLIVTGSVTATLGFTGSLFGTASWAENAISSSQATSASYAYTASSAVNSFNAITASHALTASSADNFLVRQNITASNALITGNITAQSLVVQTITSSVIYSSGSNIFGNQLTNTQTFTGSVRITGSLNVKDIPQGNYVNLLLIDTASGDIYTTSSLSILAKNADSSSYPIATTGSSLYSTSPAAGIPTGASMTGSIFFGQLAGAASTGNKHSNFLGYGAGSSSLGAENSTFIGQNAGAFSNYCDTSHFMGVNAGYEATESFSSVFLGYYAGRGAKYSRLSNFIGDSAGDRATSMHGNFIGQFAGVSASANYSTFIGRYAGGYATNTQDSIFLGQEAGYGSDIAEDSTFIGRRAGYISLYSDNSIFMGREAGSRATSSYSSVFLGPYAGYGSDYAFQSNFIGNNAGFQTTANNSNFIGNDVGGYATNADNSNFIGNQAGYQATNANNSTFIGQSAGAYAISASYSVLLGYKSGLSVNSLGPSIGSNNIIIGTNITLADNTRDSINIGGIIFASGSYSTIAGNPFSGSVINGRVGVLTNNPQFTLDVSGSGRYTNGLQVTGSLNAPIITGSLFGTSSWSQNAMTSSTLNGTGSTGFVSNMGDTYTGTAKITDIVTLNQTEYNAIGSPSTNTLYIIL